VQNLNSWLASYAQSQGISFVNYYDSMLGDGDAMRQELTDDGLHPNEAGYSVMDRIIEKSIAQTSGPPMK
jgi:lysophospholipase L1-like esterase